ncbi:MAG: metal-dependent transcriptional regulator [Polyangiaceae bacterium]|nr:metal-dependent transcriptional regulator [Polyangiaceae bacterium]
MIEAERLSSALEDYLETIYELVRHQKVARVRDIARARSVRAASVTPAMRRLADLGLIRYEKREYIDLTPQGQREAQRVVSRHQALTRFFKNVLKIPVKTAEGDACAMEHSLSAEGMDHLVRFIEFVHNCPEGARLLDVFHACVLAQHQPEASCQRCPMGQPGKAEEHRAVPLSAIDVGAQVLVRRIAADGAMRDRLLDAGLLPGEIVEVVRVAPGRVRFDLRRGGFELRLTGDEARAVLVAPPERNP